MRMRLGLLLVFGGALLSAFPGAVSGQRMSAAEARDLLRSGEYEEGLRGLRAVARGSDASPSVVRALSLIHI